MSKAKDYYNFTFPNKEEYQERYVDKLKRDLEEIGLSVYRLAIEADLTYNALMSILHGVNGPTLYTAYKINKVISYHKGLANG